ncbi:hypothetical protein QUT14_22530, partial [Xanthomonas citri pv. citri]
PQPGVNQRPDRRVFHGIRIVDISTYQPCLRELSGGNSRAELSDLESSAVVMPNKDFGAAHLQRTPADECRDSTEAHECS